LFLSQATAQAFAAHVLAEHPYPRPLFLSERHPILNPCQPGFLNDTYIVKCTPDSLPLSRRTDPPSSPVRPSIYSPSHVSRFTSTVCSAGHPPQ
jgi:hypothetical protein